MPKITIIGPTLQPLGKFRLIDWLEECLLNNDFTNFMCAMAFTKANPLYKLSNAFGIWNSKGKSSEIFVGFDHKGTSVQALEYINDLFTTKHVVHARYSTFHPKIYFFYGESKASYFCGSNNLTSGGIETNFESGILIDFDINADKEIMEQVISAFDELYPDILPCSKELNMSLIQSLTEGHYLFDETKTPTAKKQEPSDKKDPLYDLFGNFAFKPPRPVPSNMFKEKVQINTSASAPSGQKVPSTPSAINGLAIQISPHHNGEVFLSALAVKQNPIFFGFPFTGMTVPKKSGNPSYPQKKPDPIINIDIYDKAGFLVYSEMNYALNTVYYEKKSEVRITISPDKRVLIEEYSLLLMTIAKDSSYDYDFIVYNPGSAEYNTYLSLCNQTLPSGGKSVARKMGWY